MLFFTAPYILGSLCLRFASLGNFETTSSVQGSFILTLTCLYHQENLAGTPKSPEKMDTFFF